MRALLDRLYAPEWAGGWTLGRWTYGITALLTLLPRARGIGDVYGVQDMVFSQAPFYLADRVVFTEPTAWAIWGAGVVGILMLLWGGRLARPGMLLWLAAAWLLIASEALNIKAYDRLITWVGLAMLLGPIQERGLTHKQRSPFARWTLTLIFCAIYGSTGWLKAIEEPHWLQDGSVLAYHLVHHYFGLRPLGVWLSDVSWLMLLASWFTIVFEAGFPFLIWWRRLNPWLLLGGFLMHAGIFLLMNVGPFSFVAVGAYPMLLHPAVAERLYGRLRAWRSGRGAGAAGLVAPGGDAGADDLDRLDAGDLDGAGDAADAPDAPRV